MGIFLLTLSNLDISMRYLFKISDTDKPTHTMLREIYLAFIKVHILYHAAEEEVYGLGLIEGLGRHGYKLGPGMLYPTLAKMARLELLINICHLRCSVLLMPKK